MPIPDCTLTTSCFNLTKYNQHCRNIENTIQNMESLLGVPCYLIIYTDTTLYPHIKNKRDEFGFDEFTHYVVIEVEELESFKYRDIVHNNRLKYHPTKDNRTCPESHLVCCSKFELVLKSIESNPFNTSKFGWIDSNIGPNFSKIATNYTNNLLLKILKNTNPNKFHLQILNVCDKNLGNDDRLMEYYRHYRWIVCGCLFITGKEIGIPILRDLCDVFVNHTLKGYGHAEEMFYLPILDKYYDNIERSYGDYNHILNNFLGLKVGIHYVLNINFSYLNLTYYKECLDCSSYCLRAFDECEIEIDYILYFIFLFNKYISSYFIDKEIAKQTLQTIKDLIKENKQVMGVYQEKQSFYDSQFNLVTDIP
jgi:hypothetical protein